MASGAFTGLIVGMTGVGGGAIMTPVLILVLGIAPITAVGTDLLFASITKLMAVGIHRNRGTIDWQIVRRLAAGSIPAAGVTLGTMYFVSIARDSDEFIRSAVGAAIILTGAAMALHGRVHDLGRRLRITAPSHFKALQPILTVLAGAILGTLVTLTSIGAGALGTAMLVYLYPLRLSPPKLVGTDLAHAIPVAVLAGLGNIAMGSINFQLLGWLLVGSIPGAWIGARLSAKAPHKILRGVLAVILVIIGARTLM